MQLRAIVDDVLVSEHAGHVAELVAGCRAATGILIGGGDGTIFEVLQACDRTRQTLCVLPVGRGNSLARDLGLPTAECAMACLHNGVDRAIDLIDLTVKNGDGDMWRGLSASNVAIGYPAEVARTASRWRRLRGQSYVLASVLATPIWFSARLCIDGETTTATRLTGLVASKSRYVGPFLGFPDARLSDGLLHVMEMRAGPVRQWIHNASAASGYGWYEPVARREVRSLTLTPDDPALIKIDGELRDDVRHIEMKVLSGAATFRVPAPRHA